MLSWDFGLSCERLYLIWLLALSHRHQTALALNMSEEWDCYVPSEDEWAELDPGAFKFLGNYI